MGQHKVAIRVKAIDRSGLRNAEKHGKREDRRSQERRVNDIPPIVYGSLDLVDAFDAHAEGCNTNKAAKKLISHALLQFPITLPATEKNLRIFLQQSIDFINSTHGGDAVFAARIDRDEFGVNKVDVFFSPKYEKVTKTGNRSLWLSNTKFGKELCEKHRDEIERRHNGRFSTGPRQVGIALQSEFRMFLQNRNYDLAPKKEKASRFSDWLTPEDYKLKSLLQSNQTLTKRLMGLKTLIYGQQKVSVDFHDKTTATIFNRLLGAVFKPQDKNLELLKRETLNQPPEPPEPPPAAPKR